MDKKRGAINLITSIVLRVISVILNFFALRALVHMMGVDYQGLNTLFNSILGVLTIFEVGFAGAVGFCLYGPILEGDKNKIAAYYHYLKKIYFIIAIIILLTGSLTAILLPYLANGLTITWDIYLAYFSYLLGSAGLYFFSYKGVLLNAYKENYKKDIASTSASVIQHILQIVFAYLFPSFLLFSSFSLVNLLLQFLLLTVFSKKYKDIFKLSNDLTPENKKEVFKLVRGSLYHRIAGIVSNSLNTIIISSLISVTALGNYANYNTIASAIVSVLGMGMTATMSVLGHAYKSNDISVFKRYFNIITAGGFVAISLIFCGYLAASTPFVDIFYGSEYTEQWPLVLAISFNGFVNLYAYIPTTFRDSTGLFKKDVLVPLSSLMVQIILKFSLVWSFAILGVVWGNVVGYALVTIPGTCYYLYKDIFHKKADGVFLFIALCSFFFLGEAALTLLTTSCIHYENQYIQFIVNGFIGVGIATLCSTICALTIKDFRLFAKTRFLNLIRKKAKKV